MNRIIPLSLLPILLIGVCRSLGDAWTVIDPLREIYGPEDVKPAGRVLRLVGPRNGFCSAPVVISAPVKATISELTGPGGTIPADRVQLRYAVRQAVSDRLVENMDDRSKGFASKSSVRYTNTPYYDTLLESLPAHGDLIPVWVTVNIPSTTKPGKYKGALALGDQTVPVELEVCRFVCPPPSQWREHAGFDISLEVLARQYRVPQWSDAHWSLVSKTLAMAGQLGADDVHAPVFVGQNYLGSVSPLAQFVRNGDRVDPDFSRMRQYFHLYNKHVGRPRNAILHLWDPSFETRGRDRKRAATVKVMLVDGDIAAIPTPGEPGSEDAYRAVIRAAQEAIDDVGWPREVLKLGYASDIIPPDSTVDFFKKAGPGLQWTIFSHARGQLATPPSGGKQWVIAGMPIGQFGHVYVTPHSGGAPKDQTWPDGVRGGWRLPANMPTSARLWLYDYSPIRQFRGFPDAVMGQLSAKDKGGATYTIPADGFIHIGLNFWALPDGDGPRSQRGKGPQWANMFRTGINSLIAPGPAGPIATARFEMFREGMQEAEARAQIEKAILDKTIPEDAAREASNLLVKLNRVRSNDGKLFSGAETYIQMSHEACFYGYPPDWQDHAAELWNMAGKTQELTQATTKRSD